MKQFLAATCLLSGVEAAPPAQSDICPGGINSAMTYYNTDTKATEVCGTTLSYCLSSDALWAVCNPGGLYPGWYQGLGCCINPSGVSSVTDICPAGIKDGATYNDANSGKTENCATTINFCVATAENWGTCEPAPGTFALYMNGVGCCNDASAAATAALTGAVTDALATVTGSSCFAGDMRVEKTNGFAPISTLEVGDVVRTATGFEPVVGFLHAAEGTSTFVELSTDAGMLALSPDHLIFRGDGVAVPAATIKVGDVVSSGVVTGVEQVVRADGVYAPLTKSGTIVVEGVSASTYAAAHEWLSHSISHLAMTPLRILGFANSVSAPVMHVPTAVSA